MTPHTRQQTAAFASAGLFAGATWALTTGFYAAGVWLACGCAALAWVAASAGTPDKRTATLLERISVDQYADNAAAKSAAAAAEARAVARAEATDARIAAVMNFLQATQSYTGARTTGANGRPTSPLRNPLKP